MLSKLRSLIIALICFAVCQGAHARLYALCVGVDRYLLSNVEPLKSPKNDASAMASFLRSASPNSRVNLLSGPQATKQAILQNLKSIVSQATSNDIILFYFSGHGVDGALLTYDTKTAAGLLTYRELSDILKTSRTNNKLIFADACHSGSGRLKAQGDVSKNRLADGNVILFLSSRNHEKSLENAYAKNSLFTYYVLEGLKGRADADRNRSVTAKELFDYVSRNVRTVSKGAQHPVMWGRFDPQMILISF